LLLYFDIYIYHTYTPNVVCFSMRDLSLNFFHHFIPPQVVNNAHVYTCAVSQLSTRSDLWFFSIVWQCFSLTISGTSFPSTKSVFRRVHQRHLIRTAFFSYWFRPRREKIIRTRIIRKSREQKFKPSVDDILCSARVLKCTQNFTKTLQLLHGIVGQFVKNLFNFKVLVSSTWPKHCN
jgi:hypothetical protein